MTSHATPHSSTQSAAPIMRAAVVGIPPDRAFDAFVHHLGAWWPLTTHGAFGSDGTVALEGEEIIETALDGRRCVWAEVTAYEPPNRLVLQWHPGREPEEASEVEVSFTAVAGGTRVDVEHRGWERFGESAMLRRAVYARPGAWGSVLDHFGDLIEGDHRPDEGDLATLAAAYASFYDLAETGQFGPAPDGEWDAPLTIAHVALNDIAMSGVCRALIHRETPAFANDLSQDRAVMGALIERCGDHAGLVAFGRRQAATLQALLARLDPDQRESEVPCRLTHDGQVVLDAPRAWWSLAAVGQATFHLPAHVTQLTNLQPR
ncbi:MAG: SRPBCC domain-containing protein [Tetrasphaera sp.]